MDLIRVTIQGYPLQVLKTRYHSSRFIDSAECEVLGVKLGIKPRKIKEWFGNKRTRKGTLASENLQDPEILKLLDEVRRETRNKKKKIVLSTEQRDELEELYVTGRQLGEEERIAIGKRMKVPEYCIKNWWTNRSRKKKDEEKKVESSGSEGLLPDSDTTSVALMPLPCDAENESYPILRKLITDEPSFQLNDSTGFPYHLEEQAHVRSRQSKFHPTHSPPSNFNFPQDSNNYTNQQTSTLEMNPASFGPTHSPDTGSSYPQDFTGNHDEPTSTIEEISFCFAETEAYSVHLHASDRKLLQDFEKNPVEQSNVIVQNYIPNRQGFEEDPATFEATEVHSRASDANFSQNCIEYLNEPTSTYSRSATKVNPLHLQTPDLCFSQDFNNRPVEQSITIFEDYVPNPQEFGRLPATFEEAHPLAFHSNFSQTCTGYPNETTSFGTTEGYPTHPATFDPNSFHNANYYPDEQRNPALSGATKAYPFHQHTSDCNFSQDYMENPNETTSFKTTDAYPAHSFPCSDPTMNLPSTPQMPNDDGSRNYHNDSYCNPTFPTVFDFLDHSTNETNSLFHN